MLTALKQSDIEVIIQACGTEDPASTGHAPQTTPEISSPERERIYAIVEHLSREAQEELLALMWTGGPKNHNSFEENLELARKTWDENHASRLAEQHARLPIYLRDGLNRLSAQQL
jgi:hypothetical protein